MFLVAKRRQNGSPSLGAGFRRREREQMPAVSSLNPAFLSLAFACDVRSRDLSMASRYNRGRRPPKPEERKQKNMHWKSDHNRDLYVPSNHHSLKTLDYIDSMVMLFRNEVTIGSPTVSMRDASLDLLLSFYYEKTNETPMCI